MRIYKFTPSSDFAFMDIGGLFCYEEGPLKGKWFRLVRRDMLNCYCVRWTWWRNLLWKIRQRLYKEKV